MAESIIQSREQVRLQMSAGIIYDIHHKVNPVEAK
jgi:hypothetical protein